MSEGKVLVILEVSQKQAYIFSSNKLKDNIRNSAIIAWVTSSEFLEELAGKREGRCTYTEEENMVYSGGGHTILQFADKKAADALIKEATMYVLKTYPGLELFAKQYETKSVPTPNDIETLTELLEGKKSLRRASFRHGSFGIEAADINTKEPVRTDRKETEMPKTEQEREVAVFPKGFSPAYRFEDLGGSKGDKNFIAVVHIDGNAMGKRTQKLSEKKFLGKSWDEIRKMQSDFSKAIDEDFCGAYKDMCDEISKWIGRGGEGVEELSLGYDDRGIPYFPVRRVISAGDDICFVTEGRIGLECARIFIEKLSGRKNTIDQEGYAACAGVVLVHQKFPFYRAYELSEMLCSNAKKFIVTNFGEEASASVSAIDWHIEMGEPGETLKDIRKQYTALDGSHMEMRPYIIKPGQYEDQVQEERKYESFRRAICDIKGSDAAAVGKYKNLREYIKRGRQEAENYLTNNLMDDPAFTRRRPLKKEKADEYIEGRYKYDSGIYCEIGKEESKEVRSILFDPIEMMNTFIPIDTEV